MMRDLLFATGPLSIFSASVLEYLSYSSVSGTLMFIGFVCAGIAAIKEHTQ